MNYKNDNISHANANYLHLLRNFMKKNNFIAILLTFLITLSGFIFTACGQINSDGTLLIYTSMYPIYDFAKSIGGNKVQVVNLLKEGEDAHHLELKSGQMAGLEKADLIFINGQGMEGWTSSLSASLQAKIVDTSVNVTLIERTTNENPNYEENHEEEEHDHGAYDPHIWLSLKNAVIQMENIKNALVELDPQNASYYEERLQTYTYLLNGLDNEYEKALQNITNRSLVVSHRAFGYLAYENNLLQYSISGIESDIEPTPATYASIIDFINQNNIKAVFYQKDANAQVAQRITEQTNAKLYMLSTVETLTDAEIANGETYYTMMAKNLTTLVNALS